MVLLSQGLEHLPPAAFIVFIRENSRMELCDLIIYFIV